MALEIPEDVQSLLLRMQQAIAADTLSGLSELDDQVKRWFEQAAQTTDQDLAGVAEHVHRTYLNMITSLEQQRQEQGELGRQRLRSARALLSGAYQGQRS